MLGSDAIQPARSTKEAAALLREARALLRRLDKLASASEAGPWTTSFTTLARQEQTGRI
jgi:hypothetical protein